MGPVLTRTLAAVGAVLLGCAVGTTIGGALGAATTGATFGGALGAAALVAWDSARGRVLMDWLRGPQVGAAPREAGWWGEMAYRIERGLRLRDAGIEQEKQRLRDFLDAIEASPNGVLLLDGSDQIEWCNSTAADHFGLDRERDRRQPVTNLVRAPAFVTYMQRGQYDDHVVFTAPSGRGTLMVLVRRYGDGMKLVLSQDITERERAEAMRRDFVANVSHEIRTPLTVLAGFVETMTQLPLTEVERRRVLTVMAQQTDRMQALVGDLLTLAQLEGSPRPPSDRWLAVSDLMQRTQVDGLALSGGRHTLAVSGGADAEVAGSDTELISAVGNLVNNAVRYTPAGGRIDVIWRWRDDGGAELAVTDTGLGMAREHLPRLTERFYRVDGSRSRETGGTGLGLSIVKHVAQRHGGEIDITSELGKGSTFKLVLPAFRVRHRAEATLAPVLPA
ncbi:MAG: phosphate regulon sensor histidine kinase PhoR [Rubrivivax sp.]|nr:phosphate regulon sensor histidine kinase PhoR [Rubrivivax sp.]